MLLHLPVYIIIDSWKILQDDCLIVELMNFLYFCLYDKSCIPDVVPHPINLY